jgi:hypothetical protein
MNFGIIRDGKIVTAGDGLGNAYFSDEDIREFILFIKKNRPEILRDIMCEDCPEVC